MNTAEKYQYQLLETIQHTLIETPLSESIQTAYLATPRHLFVKRYRIWGTKEWHEINETNLAEHLATLYVDNPIILYGTDDDNILSTISQPSLVLYLLDLLQLKPGHKVFELGAGSGWNAALIGQIVGMEGHVDSLEIIPEISQLAQDNIKSLGIKNVNIVSADGGDGYAINAPYDRAIFTAGTYDLPQYFYEQIKEDGLLLIVIKNPGGGDHLFLLQKKDNRFESIESNICSFVQLTGKYQVSNLDPIEIETLPEWAELQHQEVARRAFWWGAGKNSLFWLTMGIRSFLSIAEPSFQHFKTTKINDRSREYQYFGLWKPEHRSLVVTKDELLITYGNTAAQEHLMQRIREWVDLGMPSAASFKLEIYPIDLPLQAKENSWIVKRRESQFLWSLKT